MAVEADSVPTLRVVVHRPPTHRRRQRSCGRNTKYTDKNSSISVKLTLPPSSISILYLTLPYRGRRKVVGEKRKKRGRERRVVYSGVFSEEKQRVVVDIVMQTEGTLYLHFLLVQTPSLIDPHSQKKKKKMQKKKVTVQPPLGRRH